MVQQNSFGKALASADKKVRDKAVKRLSKYLYNKKDLSELDLLKLWKGLFYCFWMSDKPLVQQQLSEKLASLILKIPEEIAIKFIESFWKEIRLEWTGIDRLRLDKFYYLFRQMHLNSFKFLEKVNWDITHVIKYMDIYTDGPLSLLDKTVPPSLLYHACEVFISELDKALTKPIPSSVFIEILEPFFDVVGFCSNDILVEKVVEEIFLNIVNIYENEDANELKESNIVKSCRFKAIYERLEKLNNETNILKKNMEHIDGLIVIFKGLSEAQEVLLEEQEESEEEEKEEEEEEKNIKEMPEIFKDDEIKKNEKEKSNIKNKVKGKAAKNSTKETTKKTVKDTKKKATKKEQLIEVDEDEKLEKENKKRKAGIEPIEIDDINKDESVIEVIESPRKKRKTPAKTTKKETKSRTTKNKTKAEKEKEIIVINESDEEKGQKKSEPKVAKNIKKNNKKSKNTKDKDVISESSLKSKNNNNNNNNNIKDKKIKASKSKEKNRQVETVLEIDNDDTTTSNSSNIIDNDLSPVKEYNTSPVIIINESNNSRKTKPKTKNSSKNKKSISSSTIIDLTENESKIIEKNKAKKKSSVKKKKNSKKNKNDRKLSKEEEAFVNKILRESNLIGDKSLSNSSISTTINHHHSTEKAQEKIKLDSLIKTDSAINQIKSRRGLRRSRAIDFF